MCGPATQSSNIYAVAGNELHETMVNCVKSPIQIIVKHSIDLHYLNINIDNCLSYQTKIP